LATACGHSSGKTVERADASAVEVGTAETDVLAMPDETTDPETATDVEQTSDSDQPNDGTLFADQLDQAADAEDVAAQDQSAVPDQLEELDVVDAGSDQLSPPADVVDAAGEGETEPAADGQTQEDTGQDGAAEPPASGGVDCDAGDEAWVRAALPFLAGRKVAGSAELRLLTDLVAAVGREQVALAFTRLDDFEWSWTSRLYDIAGVPRTGLTVNPGCYGTLIRPDLEVVHKHILNNDPSVSIAGEPPTLRDVAVAGLRHDDISGFFRATLFGWIARPSRFCANTSHATQDLARRRLLGAQFARVWLHRDLGCLACHNSSYAVTDSDDPAKDRHWPLPGEFEATLFGTPDASAIAADQFFSVMRVFGVLASQSLQVIPPLENEPKVWPPDPANVQAPWGLSTACGVFRQGETILADPAEVKAWLGGELDPKQSVWSLNAKLHNGVEVLRLAGQAVDSAAAAANPETAMAWLWSSHMVDQIWREAMGRPLTLPHGFSRNAPQRDRLLALTQLFVASGWSVRQLAVAISLDPLFNQAAPADLALSATPACVAATYHQPAVLEPFASDESNPVKRLNSTGDRVHREHPVVLVRSAALLAGWEPMPMTDVVANPLFDSQVPLQEPTWLAAFALGNFQNELEAGQRGLSADAYASWRQSVRDCQLAVAGAMPWPGAFGNGNDFISVLISLLKPETTLRQAIVAVWDRLLAVPDLPPTMEAALASAFGVQALDVPISAVPMLEPKLRRLCGTLLASPQFLLAGAPLVPVVGKPSIDLPGTSYAEICQALGPKLFPPADWKLTCQTGTISLVQTAP
jgi:hypothetical protein